MSVDVNLKNVIIVNDFAYINGGAAKVAISSAVELKRSGYNVIYFTAVGDLDEDIKKSGIKVVNIKAKDILNNKNRVKAMIQGIWNKDAYKKMISILEEVHNKETIVHIHGWNKALSVSVIKACQDMNFKYVITAHDYFSICPNGGLYNYKKNEVCKFKPLGFKCLMCNCDSRNYAHKLWRYIRGIVQERIIKKSKNIIALSENNGYLIKKEFRELNVFYVNNPIDIEKVERIKVENNRVIAYIGRLSKEKGPDLLALASRDCKYKVSFIGEGYLEKNLKEINSKIEVTKWLNKKELEEVFREIRVLVVPSRWYEGMPNIILEAMAKGIPVITSDICNAKEIIKDKETGLIFKTGSVESLLVSLENTYDDMFIKRISNNSYNWYWNENYTVKNHIRVLKSVYKKIVKG